MESKTEFNLNLLDKLSHEAIELAFCDHPDLILSRKQTQGSGFSPVLNDITVWQRLFFLVPATEHIQPALLGLRRLLQGTKTPEESDEIVSAVVIFLKFKLGHYAYPSEDKRTCIHEAFLDCETLWPDLTKLLIQHGACIQTKDSYRDTPLMMAIRLRFTDFQVKPELLNHYDWQKHYQSLLLSVARNLPSKNLQFILDIGANDEQPVYASSNLIHRLIKNLYIDCVPTDQQLTNLAILILNVLKQSVAKDEEIKTLQVIHFLFELALKDFDREELYREIRSLNDKQLERDDRKYSTVSLLKSIEVQHEEIECDYVEIGKGTSAIVFKGMNTKCQDEWVAIKMTPPNISTPYDNELRKEAALLSQLKHPNIVPYICSLERGGFFGIVMAYARETLDNFIDKNLAVIVKGSLPRIVKAIIVALHYMQSQGLVHRDLKPRNILMHGAQVWLTDFGSTCLKGYLSKENLTTIPYAAPENFCYKQPVDFPSDIYSLGSVILEIDTQIIPWIGDVDINIFPELVCEGQRPDLLEDKMSPGIAKLVTWCWDQAPAKRASLDEIDDYIDKTFEPATP